MLAGLTKSEALLTTPGDIVDLFGWKQDHEMWLHGLNKRAVNNDAE